MVGEGDVTGAGVAIAAERTASGGAEEGTLSDGTGTVVKPRKPRGTLSRVLVKYRKNRKAFPGLVGLDRLINLLGRRTFDYWGEGPGWDLLPFAENRETQKFWYPIRIRRDGRPTTKSAYVETELPVRTLSELAAAYRETCLQARKLIVRRDIEILKVYDDGRSVALLDTQFNILETQFHSIFLTGYGVDTRNRVEQRFMVRVTEASFNRFKSGRIRYKNGKGRLSAIAVQNIRAALGMLAEQQKIRYTLEQAYKIYYNSVEANERDPVSLNEFRNRVYNTDLFSDYKLRGRPHDKDGLFFADEEDRIISFVSEVIRFPNKTRSDHEVSEAYEAAGFAFEPDAL